MNEKLRFSAFSCFYTFFRFQVLQIVESELASPHCAVEKTLICGKQSARGEGEGENISPLIQPKIEATVTKCHTVSWMEINETFSFCPTGLTNMHISIYTLIVL